jgi:serine/threonine-protein phosphatase 6 regulatory ankyrin repeat subunit B
MVIDEERAVFLRDRARQLAHAVETQDLDEVYAYFDDLKQNDVVSIEELREIVNYPTEGMPALMRACMLSLPDIMSVLLDNEADPGAPDTDGNVPLLCAAVKDDRKMAVRISRLLLNNGAAIDIQDPIHKNTALIYAISKKNEDLAASLLSRYAGPNVQNDKGRTALMSAAITNQPVVVGLLVAKQSTELDLVDAEKQTALLHACRKNYAEVAQILLDAKADPNVADQKGKTALLYAAQKQNTRLVRELLHAGADVYHEDNNGKHAGIYGENNPDMTYIIEGYMFRTEVKRNNARRVEILLDRGVDPNFAEKDESAPLIVAIQKNHEAIVDLLLRQPGIDPNTANEQGNTALMHASKAGQTRIVRKLLAHGHIDVNAKDSSKTTALMYAAKEGHNDVVSVLLQNGADPNSQDHNGETALTFSAYHGDVDVVRTLCQNMDTEVNIKNNNDEDALFSAVFQQHEEVVNVLLQHGADVNSVSPENDDYSPLLVASKKKNVDIVEALLRKGANLFHQEKKENTALILACEHGTEAIAETLVDRLGREDRWHWEFFVDEQNEDGVTALLLASARGYVEAVEKMLDRGGNPNKPGPDGMSPLMAACAWDQTEVAGTLLAKGASPFAIDTAAKTTLMFAKSEEVARLLLGRGVIAANKDTHDRTALMFSAQNVTNEVLAVLLKEPGVKVNDRDVVGRTALLYAAELGREANAALLLENGAVVDNSDNDNMTPLKAAAQNGHLGTVELLLRAGATPNATNPKVLGVDNMTVTKWSTQGKTPLMYALEYRRPHGGAVTRIGHLDIVKALLLDPRTDPFIKDRNGKDFLIYAAVSRSKTVISFAVRYMTSYVKHFRTLISKAMDKILDEWKPSEDETRELRAAMQQVKEKNTLEEISEYIEWKHLYATDQYVMSLLYTMEKGLEVMDVRKERTEERLTNMAQRVAKHGDTRVMRYVLDALGANGVPLQDVSGHALINATKYKHIATMRLLLERGADPNVAMDAGKTALLEACLHGILDGVTMLLKWEANPNLTDTHGNTALMVACNENNDEIVRALLENREHPHQRAEPNQQTRRGETALKYAVDNRNGTIVRELLAWGADPGLANETGYNSLMVASAKGYAEIVEIILEIRPIDPNARALDGASAILLAAKKGDLATVLHLLKAKANPSVPDTNGVTPLRAAIDSEANDVVEELLRYRADPGVPDTNGVTPLMQAARLDNADVVELLVDTYQVNTWVTDNNGMTALDHAFDADSYAAMQILSEHPRKRPRDDDGDGGSGSGSGRGDTDKMPSPKKQKTTRARKPGARKSRSKLRRVSKDSAGANKTQKNKRPREKDSSGAKSAARDAKPTAAAAPTKPALHGPKLFVAV